MELGADWRHVAVAPAPISGAYANLPLAAKWSPLWRPAFPALEDEPDDWLLRRWAERHDFTATADGTSLEAYEQPCREGGATARALLAKAAAFQWGVDWRECEAQGGFITHGRQRLPFGELAADAAGYRAPGHPPLRAHPPADPTPPGAVDALPFPRLDLPSKVDGSYLFAGDVRLPDMVYAAIRHGPLDEPTLNSFESAAARRRGLVAVVKGKRWVAAVATDWWSAEQAADALAPRFRAAHAVNSARMEQALDKAVRHGNLTRVATRGQGDDALLGSAKNISLALRYDVMPAAHGTIETASCTAHLSGGKLELWLASQSPERARVAAAEALGMAAADVVLYPMPAGGSFDRRLEHDHAIEAALIAREVKRPVQLTWSRWQEHLMLRPRAPVAAVLAAKLWPDGRIDTLRARLAMPPSAREFGRRLFDNRATWSAIDGADGEADPLALEGLMPPYAIPNVAIDHVPVRLPLPTGRLRGNAHGYTAFMIESFIDEVAARTHQEPLSFRISMLGEDLRLAACLQRAATLGNWGGGEAGTAQGIACHRIGPPERSGYIALVATAAAGEGGVRVQRLAAAVDIGRVINRDIALQQVEGGLLYGVGLALGSGVEYARGLPVNGRLGGLGLPTLADAPEIKVDLIESRAAPFDPGELAVAPVAPAIANALHSATGLRLRRLPLLSEAL